MLVALFSDIHANRQAFSACLAAARAAGVERYILLGDYVGYGGDPEWVVEKVMEMVAEGAIAIQGNHDFAVSSPREGMTGDAQLAIEWTRGELGAAHRAFLAGLPLTHEEDDWLFVHSDGSKPKSWIYVTDVGLAARSMAATPSHATFCGHVHKPALYSMSMTAKMTSFTPRADGPVQLLQGRQWLTVLGSVGQPRDGNPAASWLKLDTRRNEITFCRVPYDVDAAAARIRERGLPDWLARRLLIGK